MSFSVTIDVIDFHPKFNQALSTTKNLKDVLKSYMDREIVNSGEATYKAATEAYMTALDDALVAYEGGATEQDTFTLTQQEADVLYYEKVALDAEIAALEADPDIDDLEAVPQYREMKLRQVYLEDVYQQLLTQGYVPSPAPVADFSATPLVVGVGESVQFTDLSTNFPSQWLWNFGTSGVPDSNEQNPLINFPAAGTYDITLTATNAAGDSTPVTKTAYIEVVAVPVAAFSATPLTAEVGDTITFTDESTNTPTEWAWTFLDGTPASSLDQNPTVTYAAPGVYNASLVAKNAGGSSEPLTKEAYITITETPAP